MVIERERRGRVEILTINRPEAGNAVNADVAQGIEAALGAAAWFVAMAVACPVSGHHSFGAWWYGQMACALGLVAITVAALRRS